MFTNFNFIPESNKVLVGTLPNEIFLEISKFVEYCISIKDHPLGSLRNHLNSGENSYQIAIPKPLIEQSFMSGLLDMSKDPDLVVSYLRLVRTMA